MSNENKTYSQTKAISSAIEKALLGVNTMMIVKVVAFDSDNQTVDVQPCVMMRSRNDDSTTTFTNRLGEVVPYEDVEMPVILKAPLCYMRSGNYMVTIPVQVGDTGMLIISQRDISIWKQKGDIQPQGEVSVFDINDGVFLPFVPNQVNKISDYNNNALEIRADSDKITLDGSGTITFNAKIKSTAQIEGAMLKADNGATGTMTASSHTGSITVVDGIVTSIIP